MFIIAYYFVISYCFHLPEGKTSRNRGVNQNTNKLFDLCNKYRQENRLPPYIRCSELDNVASSLATKMAQNKNYLFGNKAAIDNDFNESIKSCGFDVSKSSKSVVSTKSSLPEDVLGFFKKSKGLNQKLLSSSEEAGFAVAKSNDNVFYWVSVYGTELKNQENSGNEMGNQQNTNSPN